MNAAALVTVFLVAVVPLVPTEPVLVGLGVLAAASHTLPVAVISVAAVGCAISDHLLYATGRFAGRRALGRFLRRPAGAAAQDWLARTIARWGAPAMVAGRWLPGGGTVSAVLAGTLHWGLPRFTPASVVGAALWSAYATLLGYFGGAVTRQPVAGLLLSLGIAIGLGLLTSVAVRRSAQKSRCSQVKNSLANS